MRQRQLGQGAEARRELGRGRFEKLEPCGRVEEEIADLHARAGVGRDLEPLLDRPALAGQPEPVRRSARAARQREARDGADRRQRLTAEPECRDRVEILVARQLGRRVALEGQRQLVGRHPDAVVGDADERGPAVAQIDRDRQGSGVQRVLHQLLDGRGGALDDLSGGDLVDEVVGQPADFYCRGVHEPGSDRGWPDTEASRLRICHFARMFSASSGVR